MTRSILVTGNRYTPPSDPPIVDVAPWYRAVVTYNLDISTSTGFYTVTAKNIQDELLIQVSVVGVYIELRVRAVSAWEITGVPIGLQCFDPVQASPNSESLISLVDVPARNQWARVGFRWSKPHSAHVFAATSGAQICTFALSNPAKLRAQFHVDWRFKPKVTATFDQIGITGSIYPSISNRQRELSQPLPSSSSSTTSDFDICEALSSSCRLADPTYATTSTETHTRTEKDSALANSSSNCNYTVQPLSTSCTRCNNA